MCPDPACFLKMCLAVAAKRFVLHRYAYLWVTGDDWKKDPVYCSLYQGFGLLIWQSDHSSNHRYSLLQSFVSVNRHLVRKEQCGTEL